MKLLLDQGLPRSTTALLRNVGIDTVHVGEIGLATAEDVIILEEGRRSERVVVTLDADFHASMALSGARTPSVIASASKGCERKRWLISLKRYSNTVVRI